MMTLSKVFGQTLDAYQSGKYTIISNFGGTRSGKTYSTLQLLYLIAIGSQENLLISVVSRTMSHLKRGCIRDFEAILESNGNVGFVSKNKTDMIWTFKNNNRIEFFSADNVGKMHGSARDILYVNECNYIDVQKIQQLFVRTKSVKFIDYNPSADFWIDDYKSREDFVEFHSTYLDNDFLTPEQIHEIECNRKNKRWWTIYGEGKGYVREGLCYPNVKYDKTHHWEHPTYGIDFGYHDPTACVKVEIIDDKIYVEQVFYRSGMDVTDIKTNISRLIPNKHLIICDSASPQIIHELKNSGYNVKPCIKGKNSVFDGIQLANNFEIHVVSRNLNSNLVNEFKKYSYEQDMNGNWTDIPEDRHNHALDAFRYVVSYLRNKKNGNYNYSFV